MSISTMVLRVQLFYFAQRVNDVPPYKWTRIRTLRKERSARRKVSGLTGCIIILYDANYENDYLMTYSQNVAGGKINTPLRNPNCGQNVGGVPKNTRNQNDRPKFGDPNTSTTSEYGRANCHRPQRSKKLKGDPKGPSYEKIEWQQKTHGRYRPNIMPLFSQFASYDNWACGMTRR